MDFVLNMISFNANTGSARFGSGGVIEMGVAWMQGASRWAGNGGRWLPTALETAAAAGSEDASDLVTYLDGQVLTCTDQPEIPASISVTDCRVMEVYFMDKSAPRVIGFLNFGKASAGPPGRAHGGVVSSAMDESFVWLGAHAIGGP